MKLYLLYTPNTPADRDIAQFQRRLAERRIEPLLTDADSRAGIALAELYDVMSRPAAIATADDGVLLAKWEGALPSVDEVSAYVSTI